MEVFVGGRASGKTTKLAERYYGAKFYREGRAAIVVPDRIQADFIARNHGINPEQIHTTHDLAYGALRGQSPMPVYVDNLDAIIESLVWPGYVDLATITADKATLLGGTYE